MNRHSWRCIGAAAISMIAFAIAASLVFACGGGQTHPNLFSTDWEDDGGKTIEAVRQRLLTARVVRNANVAVGISGQADRLSGIDLETKTKWSFPHAIDARPIVTGPAVVASGGGEVFALDARTGKKYWSRATGALPLRGAADDGTITVMTFTDATGKGSTLLAVDRAGKSVRQIETDKILGTPAVIQGYAFVPWANQYVSVIDLSNGDEAARLVLRDKVSHAFVSGGSLFFGELRIVRFDDKIRLASRGGATRLRVLTRPMPGDPTLFASGEKPRSPIAGAPDKVGLFVRPGGLVGSELEPESTRYYATYFRFAMGVDAANGKLGWVHTHPVDIVAGAAAEGSFVICDEQGKVFAFDAQFGSPIGEWDLGGPQKGCVVSADALRLPPFENATKPLLAQLSEAVLLADDRLFAGQKVLVRDLASLEDERATKVLIDVAGHPRPIAAEAKIELAKRRTGSRSMLDALGTHYDFLNGKTALPPTGPMAEALAGMREKAAAPLLVEHLLDPATPDADLVQIARALVDLASTEQADRLRDFVGMHRATSVGDGTLSALMYSGDALLKIGDKPSLELIDFAAKDEMTSPTVREHFEATLQKRAAANANAHADAGSPDAGPPSSGTSASGSIGVRVPTAHDAGTD